MKVWRKQTVRYVNKKNGKKATKDDPLAVKQLIESKRYYGTLNTSDGKRKQIPLTEDADASLTLLQNLQREADKDKALGITPTDRKKEEPLKTWIERYNAYLNTLNRNPHHVETVIKRATLIFGQSKITTIAAIEPDKLLATIAKWRKNGKPEPSKNGKRVVPSLETCNHYLRSAKAVTRWLWRQRIIADDPLRGLQSFNSDVERAKVRRAMSDVELQTLVTQTRQFKTYGGKRWRLTGNQRALLYLLAASTGLRASELASLKRSAINIPAATITIQAKAAKNKRADTLPLRGNVLTLLKSYLESLSNDAYLFPGTWADERKGAELFKRDCKLAGITTINADNESLDFHALRTSFITSLARSGVHPSVAQRLARHSTITLTMNTYTKIGTDELLREAVERLPDIK